MTIDVVFDIYRRVMPESEGANSNDPMEKFARLARMDLEAKNAETDPIMLELPE